MVEAKDLVLGKSYKDSRGVYGKLLHKEDNSNQDTHNPLFTFTFQKGDETLIIKRPWDADFYEVTVGGKRKSRRNKKSKKTRRKSNRN